MKKRTLPILIVFISIFLFSCKPIVEYSVPEFEYDYDKFYLSDISENAVGLPTYVFLKKIYNDFVDEKQSVKNPEGYRLYGDTMQIGQWDYLGIGYDSYSGEKEILAQFICFSQDGMGDTKLNIYFNYTVASTGERKEEVWEVDFGQKPYEDKRGE